MWQKVEDMGQVGMLVLQHPMVVVEVEVLVHLVEVVATAAVGAQYLKLILVEQPLMVMLVVMVLGMGHIIQEEVAELVVLEVMVQTPPMQELGVLHTLIIIVQIQILTMEAGVELVQMLMTCLVGEHRVEMVQNSLLDRMLLITKVEVEVHAEHLIPQDMQEMVVQAS